MLPFIAPNTKFDIPQMDPLMWGVYLRGSFSIDFGLPAIIINFINDRGWGNIVSKIPYIGDVSHHAPVD